MTFVLLVIYPCYIDQNNISVYHINRLIYILYKLKHLYNILIDIFKNFNNYILVKSCRIKEGTTSEENLKKDFYVVSV